MAILTRAQLKALWVSLFKPFQTNYNDVWDSFIAPEDNPALDGMTDPFAFGGQAHAGDSLQSFSASKTFDLDNGNVQEMVVTASTTIGITNEQAGVFIFRLPINSGASPVITIGPSFGDVMDGSLDLLDANNDVNIITLTVWPSGAKEYTVNTRTA
jgi:hypothetical protein